MPVPPCVEFLAPASADDAGTTSSLAAMINGAYTIADAGLWDVPSERTNPGELAHHIRAGELAVAVAGREVVVGCVRVRQVDDATAEFGLLAARTGRWGAGVGRALVGFAEQAARDAGRTVMELELMAPRDGPHPAKDFLRAWYERLGYRAIGRSDLATVHPGLGPRLARPCDFVRYRKPLRG